MQRIFAFVVLCHAVVQAGAQSPPAQAAATGSAAATASGFRCGGVGQDEQARMKADAPAHDLLLTFASGTGAYVADVDVEIRSGGNVVLRGRCEGPLMLVDLPADGPYEVRAVLNGREQRKTVSIGGKLATATFVWQAP